MIREHTLSQWYKSNNQTVAPEDIEDVFFLSGFLALKEDD